MKLTYRRTLLSVLEALFFAAIITLLLGNLMYGLLYFVVFFAGYYSGWNDHVQSFLYWLMDK